MIEPVPRPPVHFDSVFAEKLSHDPIPAAQRAGDRRFLRDWGPWRGFVPVLLSYLAAKIV